MDTYLLIYLYVVLIYGIYLCVSIDDMQIPSGSPSSSNDDSESSKVLGTKGNTRLRGINNTINMKQKEYNVENKQQDEKEEKPKKKVYTDDDFICDCNNVYKEKHELERDIIQDMINKHYLRSGRKILTYKSDGEDTETIEVKDENENEEKIREENNTRICDCEGNRKKKSPHEWILLIPPSNVMLERENKTDIKTIDEISRTHLRYALASMFEAR